MARLLCLNAGEEAALNAVVDYNWNDELEDYRDNCGDGPDDNQRKHHVFELLCLLRSALIDERLDPREVAGIPAEEEPHA